MNDQTPDEELRALLRSADPARSLPPTPPDRIRSTAGRTTAAAARAGAPLSPAQRPDRRRAGVLAGGLAAAAAAVVAALTLTTGGAAVTALTVPAPADPLSSICAPVTAEGLRQSASAFEARVTGTGDGRVDLEVVRRYAGDVQDRVTLPQPADGAADSSLGPLVEGRTYLISTADGTQVSGCGQSGPADPELAALFAQAFGG